MTRSSLLHYALFAIAYLAIWVVILAPQTVAGAFGTSKTGSISQHQADAARK